MRPLLLGSIALLASGCGERPQRVSGAPTSQPEAALPATPSAAKFSGRLVLEGELVAAKTGAVFLSARRKGQRLPVLSRKYEIGDPAWTTQGERRILEFALTDADNMGGFGSPFGADMEVEARFDPDGFIDPKPGAEDPGVVKVAVPARPGDREISIILSPEKSAK